MKELMEKIASYNLFNYLFPGVIFIVFVNWITNYTFKYDNLIVGAFLSYFVGLSISRIGSLIIEPIFKKIKFLKFAPYKDFVDASKKDTLIAVLSEVNNMYRTIASMALIIILLKLYEILEGPFSILKEIGPYLLLFGLLILYIFSYRKQTDYLRNRVNANK